MHRWTAEMIVVIMSDDVCRREFAAFILDVMNGTIDESVRNRLVRARADREGQRRHPADRNC